MDVRSCQSAFKSRRKKSEKRGYQRRLASLLFISPVMTTHSAISFRYVFLSRSLFHLCTPPAADNVTLGKQRHTEPLTYCSNKERSYRPQNPYVTRPTPTYILLASLPPRQGDWGRATWRTNHNGQKYRDKEREQRPFARKLSNITRHKPTATQNANTKS
jgi:hypothetical protein